MQPVRATDLAAGLAAGLEDVRAAPSERGTVELLLRRPAVGEREALTAVTLDEVDGVVGDCWRTRGSSRTPDGGPHPEMQVTLMGARAAALIAGPDERWPLAGDQLYVDLDLSPATLPAGSLLAVGSAVLEISAAPHLGCRKFAERFGADALRLVNSPEGRALRLRGVNTRVLRGGVVRTGDEVRRLPAGVPAN